MSLLNEKMLVYNINTLNPVNNTGIVNKSTVEVEYEFQQID